MKNTSQGLIYTLLTLMLMLASDSQADPAAQVNLGLANLKKPNHQQVALGKKLFFDRRLSSNGTLSCAMCHIPEQGFAQNQLSTPVGVEGRSVKRNSPTLLNVAYRQILFHDGREFTLENQVWSPILSHQEMANVSIGAVINRLQQLDDYPSRFKAAYHAEINISNVGQAIAAYERTLIAANSPFDQWHFGGNEAAVDNRIKLGFQLFIKNGCSSCHNIGIETAQFTDDQFHNTGIGYARSMIDPVRGTRTITLAETVILHTAASFEQESLNDLGRYEMTGIPADKWKYRTPTLRNVALTAPYMHDGSIATLEEVIAFYSRGGIANEGLDARIQPFMISDEEAAALAAFLRSLTSANIQQLIDSARDTQIGDYQ